jgi:hypothetical protein
MSNPVVGWSSQRGTTCNVGIAATVVVDTVPGNPVDLLTLTVNKLIRVVYHARMSDSSEKVNVRKNIVDSVYDILSSTHGGLCDKTKGSIKVRRDDTNPYVLVITSGDQQFRVRIKEF